MIRSTGHASRPNRFGAAAYFGNEQCSQEALLAEVGSAAMSRRLQTLRNDRWFIVSASGEAETTVALILGE